MSDDTITVSVNENPTINLEITAYRNNVDLNFVESIESVVSVHNTDSNAHSNIINGLISSKANLSEMTTALASKIDIINGKGLSTNDLTNALKSNYDTAYADSHIHSNKNLLDSLISSGDGTSYLANNGNYKKVNINIPIGICSTITGTTEKAVILDGFTLVTGATIQVKFTNANTATVPTLNVNSTGAKAIYNEAGTAVSVNNPAYFPAGSTVEFIYNGTYWIFKKRVVENYVNGTSWYRVYADGWIEQGGRITVGASSGAVTLLKPYSNTNFTLITQYFYYDIGVGYYSNCQVVYPTSSSTFGWCSDSNASTHNISWQTCGY
jgi:hypothetical protein